ncbi:MAG: ATP-dependent DNA helicase RecG [Prevotella sp.]|nr:ATP-dependent DNA helicase RecG [Prevotella sp.]MCM1075266.1 ATP-dependent DNA helicase RecG [Ruminococcus sp.]
MSVDPGNTGLQYIKGVGEIRAKLLAKELGINTVRDLLYMPPLRYIDRSRMYPIKELTTDMPAVQVLGRFVNFMEEGEGVRRRRIGLFTDGKSLMQVTWFKSLKWVTDSIHTGMQYVLLAKPSEFNRNICMIHPEVELYNPEKPPQGLRGVYSLTETLRKRGFSPKTLSGIIANFFAKCPDGLPETLPRQILDKYSLMPLGQALRHIHFPGDQKLLQSARERMKFEELFFLQLHILRYARRRNSALQGQRFTKVGEYFNSFYSKVLPFELTGAQKRVIKEIRRDMNTGVQMNRLLQGDVGSGKTMVAFMTMLLALDNGFQACLMAPTEILATQHYETINTWASAIGVKVMLLTGSTKAKQRREIHEGLTDGSINLLIGTHALIEDNVKFKDLGLAVIDEQHRFGVAQRSRLWAKNNVAPHVLVMTATPIPRTLAMTVYGDLKLSVIDELPPGRKPVTTLLRYEQGREGVWRAVGRELAKGRQVYVVYPLISENEKVNLKSLEQGYENVRGLFPSYTVCYVHGRMKPAEKEYQMQQFVSGQAQILVATTVIEVGVNVPNASVMIIENAERFGLSQLHQLRGRVGRGAEQSYCILMSKQQISATTRKRLEVMTETTDGFLISEADMQMRGPGDMEGTQQSGIPINLQHASLATDGQILTLAREAAEAILDAHPEIYTGRTAATEPDKQYLRLNEADLLQLKTELHCRFAHTAEWGRIS